MIIKKSSFHEFQFREQYNNYIYPKPVEDIEKELSDQKSAIKSIFDMRRIYSEKFESTSIAQDAVRIRNSLGDFLDLELSNRLDGKEMKELETKFGKIKERIGG